MQSRGTPRKTQTPLEKMDALLLRHERLFRSMSGSEDFSKANEANDANDALPPIPQPRDGSFIPPAAQYSAAVKPPAERASAEPGFQRTPPTFDELDRSFPPNPYNYKPVGVTPKKQKSRALRIALDVVVYGLLVCLVVGAIFLSRGDRTSVFGLSFMEVRTPSMQPDIPQGSLVVVRDVDENDIVEGNDITYTRDADTTVTHRVIGIIEDFQDSGERGFETRGIDNDDPDFAIVPASNVVGKVAFHVPRLGRFLTSVRAHRRVVVGVLVGFVLLVLLIKVFLWRKKSIDSGSLILQKTWRRTN